MRQISTPRSARSELGALVEDHLHEARVAVGAGCELDGARARGRRPPARAARPRPWRPRCARRRRRRRRPRSRAPPRRRPPPGRRPARPPACPAASVRSAVPPAASPGSVGAREDCACPRRQPVASRELVGAGRRGRRPCRRRRAAKRDVRDRARHPGGGGERFVAPAAVRPERRLDRAGGRENEGVGARAVAVGDDGDGRRVHRRGAPRARRGRAPGSRRARTGRVLRTRSPAAAMPSCTAADWPGSPPPSSTTSAPTAPAAAANSRSPVTTTRQIELVAGGERVEDVGCHGAGEFVPQLRPRVLGEPGLCQREPLYRQHCGRPHRAQTIALAAQLASGARELERALGERHARSARRTSSGRRRASAVRRRARRRRCRRAARRKNRRCRSASAVRPA